MSSSFFNAGRQGTPTTTPTTSGTRVASGSQSGTPTTMDSRAGASTATFFASETTSTGVVDVHLRTVSLVDGSLVFTLTNGNTISQSLDTLGSIVSFDEGTQTLTIDGTPFVLSGGGTGDVTLAQLNAEIAARTTADTGLSDRITTLENAPPSTGGGSLNIRNLTDTAALTANEFRISPKQRLFETTASASFLIETNTAIRTLAEAQSDTVVVKGINLDLSNGDLDISANSIQLESL